VQCRGPLLDQECVQDRWEILLDSSSASLKGDVDDGDVGGQRQSEQAQSEQGHWIAIDLGSIASVVGVLLDWGVEHAKAYEIEVSEDAVSWQTVYTEWEASSQQNDASSMHVVHAVDLRKSGRNSAEVVRPHGIRGRFVRLRLPLGAGGTVSLWRIVALGTRADARMLAHTGNHRLQMYLTDKGGNDLGVKSTLINVIIIDPRPMCAMLYLVYGDRYTFFAPPHAEGWMSSGSSTQSRGSGRRCIFELTSQEQHNKAIFAPNASVAYMRNRLFEEVHRNKINFLFLVFVDASAELQEVADYGLSSNGGPWATFERYLLAWLPAVGFPHHPEAHWDDSREVQLSYNFNVVAVGVTAFHREAVAALLPYSTLLEHQSVWQPGIVQNSVASVLYNVHRLQFNALHVNGGLGGASRRGSSGVLSARDRHADALDWLAPAFNSMHAVLHVSWSEALVTQPPAGGEAARKNSSYLLRPPSHSEARGEGWWWRGMAWPLDPCHPYFESKQCAGASHRCPHRAPTPDCHCALGSRGVVTHMMGLLQQLHANQVAAETQRAKSYFQSRPFRVRSPQTGVQVGLVAASLAELRSETAHALEIHHPWSVRLLLVEPDGRGATELMDERFFATVPANALLIAIRADTLPDKLVPVAKYTAKEL